ncbi:hypothetical protein SAMN02983003_0716 [Devosia enhydra]|uniref:Outer membrane protein beta-barrel domain-containing protein n=1 Tax=Devosia enhydra TaxID=665118 RepID=A0A1K2HTY5_9HYPH|nr:hypothetical protein [Devosia enhydra]SFZ81829.1 hypothetical protein SAMN02983003_0716 [Devosia enhydra]
MLRTAVSTLALMMATVPAMAADWDEWSDADMSFRGSQWVEPKDWTELGDGTDSLGFEFGTRYWYSLGAHSSSVGGLDKTTEDAAHFVEGHLRIEDARTRTYAKGLAGYAMAVRGSYDTGLRTGETLDGQIGYIGADMGYMAFGSTEPTEGFGPLLGYLYWNDSPRTTREGYTTNTAVTDWSPDTGQWSLGFDSQDDNMDIHALRLGVQTRAKLGEMIDVTAELAAVPYAHVSGTLGSHSSNSGPASYPVCNVTPPDSCPTYSFQSSPTTFSGWGYGAMGELMVGLHPTENLTFRLGGRAWYLQGTHDATYTRLSVTPPQLQAQVPVYADDGVTIEGYRDPDPLYGAPSSGTEDFIQTSNPFSLMRYGLLAELTYRF